MEKAGLAAGFNSATWDKFPPGDVNRRGGGRLAGRESAAHPAFGIGVYPRSSAVA